MTLNFSSCFTLQSVGIQGVCKGPFTSCMGSNQRLLACKASGYHLGYVCFNKTCPWSFNKNLGFLWPRPQRPSPGRGAVSPNSWSEPEVASKSKKEFLPPPPLPPLWKLHLHTTLPITQFPWSSGIKDGRGLATFSREVIQAQDRFLLRLEGSQRGRMGKGQPSWTSSWSTLACVTRPTAS